MLMVKTMEYSFQICCSYVISSISHIPFKLCPWTFGFWYLIRNAKIREAEEFEVRIRGEKNNSTQHKRRRYIHWTEHSQYKIYEKLLKKTFFHACTYFVCAFGWFVSHFFSLWLAQRAKENGLFFPYSSSSFSFSEKPNTFRLATHKCNVITSRRLSQQ